MTPGPNQMSQPWKDWSKHIQASSTLWETSEEWPSSHGLNGTEQLQYNALNEKQDTLKD